MSIPMLNKLHMNGYDVLSVNNGPWRVCTQGDRLASFSSREEAMAYAAALPGYKKRAKRVQDHSPVDRLSKRSPGFSGAFVWQKSIDVSGLWFG